ncbi:NmrA family NAD(P)-binding protein [Pedobacter miscanthi]|uniref:NmrA family transcriptional regulator n=1 Tax=Pedobacter miscanthi TaxID=2259170 RepID=A0A366LDQ8_9SPHI|nr:NmrA family NAD(P)-binding protein [Pedobacter miscanthi]RBQ11414.1 NmrA family transcriptional regulator [Pedobacter miscanthi]
MIAITGITGHVGRVTATLLLEQKQDIKAIVRNTAKGTEWKDKGADVAIADLFDAESLTKAFEGAESIFVMTPPALDLENPIEQHLQMLEAITTAIKKSNPKKLVYLSSIGAHLAEGTGAIRKLYDMEQALTQLDIPTAGIRAGWFMENFTGSLSGAIATGNLHSFLNPTDLKVPMVAVADIGKTAAALLLQDWEGHRIIELEGPQAYSANDVAAVIGNLTGETIIASPILREDYESTYSSFGFTPNASNLMSKMNDGFNNQWIVFEKKNTEHVCGETSLEEMLGKVLQV